MGEKAFHNDGARPLCTPGFNGLAFDLVLPIENRFSYGPSDLSSVNNSRLTVRELAMLHLMEMLTDRIGWHVDITDEQIVAEWRKEALSLPLISDAAWQWCVQELKDMASHYKTDRFVCILNAGNNVCKSDDYIPDSLKAGLQCSVQRILKATTTTKHSAHRDTLTHLVDPSLHPLVYGETKVMMNGGSVKKETPVLSCGQGVCAPTIPPQYLTQLGAIQYSASTPSIDAGAVTEDAPFWERDPHSPYGWSRIFQWLPSDVDFTGLVGTTDVGFSSYINNLHPQHSKALYEIIERLIALAIEPWNRVLVKSGIPRCPLRIQATSAKWTHRDMPHDVELISGTEGTDSSSPEFRNAYRTAQAYLAIPEHGRGLQDEPATDSGQSHPTFGQRQYDLPELALGPEEGKKVDYFLSLPETPVDWNETYREWTNPAGRIVHSLRMKALRLRRWEHPDVDVAFTYEDWKSGKNVIAEEDSWSEITVCEPYEVCLQDTFRENGLQVYVKISSIDLTPEQPFFNGGDWQKEHHINEHIVATALYTFDARNTTSSRLSFCQQTFLDAFSDEQRREPDQMATVFGVLPSQEEEIWNWILTPSTFPSLQELGNCVLKNNRFLAWPDTLQHKLEPVELVDKTQPGYIRFITLYLADPYYRVCSTKNVPPQQHDWWIEEAIAAANLPRVVPAEIVELIDAHTDGWPMSRDQAEAHRRSYMSQ